MTFFETAILGTVFLCGLSIVWSSLRTGITPVPSTRKARLAMLKAAQAAPAGPILELGSGWGQLAVNLAKACPERRVIGYELSPLPWLFSLLLKKFNGTANLTLKRQNFLAVDLPPAALLVCYLYPGGMQKLACKLHQEKPQIATLVSNTFALPGYEPDSVQRLDDLYHSPIYLYRFAAPKKD